MPLDSSFIRKSAFVNGTWCDAQSGGSFDVMNPASGELITSVPDMDAED